MIQFKKIFLALVIFFLVGNIFTVIDASDLVFLEGKDDTNYSIFEVEDTTRYIDDFTNFFKDPFLEELDFNLFNNGKKTDDRNIVNEETFDNDSYENVYVDDDADPSWYNASQVRTIAEGIYNASDGGTVYVYSGTYYENVIVDKSITLQGEDKNTTIIDGMQYFFTVGIDADNVNVSGFTIQNTSDSFFMLSCGIYIISNHVIISNNIIKDNIGFFLSTGIYAVSCDNNTFSNNIIKDNNGSFLFAIYTEYSNNNTISNNLIFNNSYYGMGVSIYVAGGSHNNINNNTCYNDAYGIVSASASNCDVENNTVSNYYGTTLNNSYLRAIDNNTIGLYCSGSTNINIINNNFYNTSLFLEGEDISDYYQNIYDNFVNGKPLFYSTNNSDLSIPDNVGEIILVNYTNFIIEDRILNYTSAAINLCCSNNIILRNLTISNSFTGLYQLYSDNCSIYNNTFIDNGIGIGFALYSDNCSIYNNTFTDNVEGIGLSVCYNNEIFHNNFFSSALYHAIDDTGYNNWYNTSLNQGNYWDNYSGTDENNDGIGDIPYDILVDNQDLYPLMYERTSPPTFVWVDDNYNSLTPGWNVDHFDNIQKAIDNVTENGDIYVYTGTYYENIVIYKSINLVGQNKNTTIIDGGGSGDVVYISTNYVNISGFAIQNSGNDFCGINTSSNFSSINNNVINNSYYGIVFENYSSNNTISSNTINNNSYCGIWIYYYSTDNAISGNTINNSNYAMIFFYSSINTISCNTITNSLSSINFYYSSNNTIYGNTNIGNAENGINFAYSDNNTIYKNTVTDSLNGVYFYYCNNNTVYHNNFINNTQNSNATGNNTWYNTTLLEGNYWDDYTGIDADGDHIGDTQYNITGGDNNDTYPLIYEYSYYYGLVVSAPSQVNEKKTFVVSVSTSSGATLPNVEILFNGHTYNTSTGEKTLTAPSVSSNTNYWINVTASGYNTNSSFITVKNVESNGPPGPSPDVTPVDEIILTNPPTADANGPYEGLTFENIVFDGSGSEDNGTIANYTWSFGDNTNGYGVKPVHSYSMNGSFTVTLKVTDNDGLTDTITTYAKITLDIDGDGWSDEDEEYYGSNKTNIDDVPLDIDKDGIPDLDDDDDDNDGLSDQIEKSIGSNLQDSSDVHLININGSDFYLIDLDNDGAFDSVYNLIGRLTYVGLSEDGGLLLDVVGDDKWDYYYNPLNSEITAYQEKTDSSDDFPWIILIIGIIIIIVVLTIFILFKKGYIWIEKYYE